MRRYAPAWPIRPRDIVSRDILALASSPVMFVAVASGPVTSGQGVRSIAGMS